MNELVRKPFALDLFPQDFFERIFEFDTPWIPAVDIAEDQLGLIIKADLPGIDKDDLRIEVEDEILTISGQRATEQSKESNGYHRIERAYGSFSRRLRLPGRVAVDNIVANYENGVLEIRVPQAGQKDIHQVQITEKESN